MGNLGMPELLIIVLVIVIFFGAKKIPELAQGLGKGMREFRKATREIQDESEDDAKAPALKGPNGQIVTCFNCSAQVARDAKFCPSCGTSLELPKCAKCGTVNALGAKFCSECGSKM